MPKPGEGTESAAVYAKVPPFSSYDVHTKLHMFKNDDGFDRRVTVRTADQFALVFDERTLRDRSRPYAVSVVDDAGDRLIHVNFIPGRTALQGKTWFTDAYIDKSNDLPIRNYQTVQGHWLLKPFATKSSVP